MKLTDQFESLPGIYIFTNLINRKQYIGETVDIKCRMTAHKTRANCEKNQIISKAISKYGIENFKVYVEYLPDFKKNDLLDLEEQLIIRFNTLVPNGYNVCSRGQDNTGNFFSEETRKKMSKSQTGRKHSLETIEKMKKSNKRARLGKKASVETRVKQSNAHKGEKNANFGKRHSTETKLKISEKAKGRKLSDETKRKISESLRSSHPLRLSNKISF